MVNGMSVGGGEGFQHSGVRSSAEDSGVGSLALWPMIKPDGVMTSGMWRSLFLFD